MRGKSAKFITSAAHPRQFPPQSLPEVAFAGRSNVGKSSLINALCGVKGLAKTSRTPGRTRLLNWFEVVPPSGPPVAFVDLPGYGYAKVSRSMREAWRPLIESYLGRRDVLRAVISLVDVRRGAQEEERELYEWLDEAGVPCVVVLTKADKLPKNKRKPVALQMQRELSLPRAPVLFSATSGEGIDDLWRAIGRAMSGGG